MLRFAPRVLAVFVAVSFLHADAKKSIEDQRVELLRGLLSEYAKVKAPLPQSKKALEFNADGTYDEAEWADAGRQFGPAGRVGDLIQVTHVEIDKDKIVLVVNGGMKGGKGGFWSHVEVGAGGTMTPVKQ